MLMSTTSLSTTSMLIAWVLEFTIQVIGIKFYFSIIGVEVNRSEYAYGGNSLMDSTGVYEMTPKQHDVFIFKESILVGEVEREDIIWSSLHKMMKKFRANEYDMLK